MRRIGHFYLNLFALFVRNRKVRNAIQALQEMTYSTLASQMDLGGRFPPARSIPNLPNETFSMAPSAESYALARSSSQPAEMWGRNIIAHSDHIHQYGESAENVMAAAAAVAAATATASKPFGVSAATQTENKIDLPAMEKFIVSNPRLVLNLLGIIEPSYQFECELQPQTLIPIPEADVSSPEALSPPENHSAKKFTFGEGSHASGNLMAMETAASPPPMTTVAVWNSPHNSNNKNTENSRSTDALLGNSSDDCLLPSDENLSRVLPLPETINFTIVREGSTKSRHIVTNCSRSSSMNSLSSTTHTTPKQSVCDLSASTAATTTTMATATTLQRNHHGHSLKRKQSWKDNNNMTTRKSSTPVATVAPERLSYSADDDAGIDAEDDNTNFDELSEKCALLCNDVRKNSNARSSTSQSDIQKRNHLVPRPPYSYRFSAGDADKLEKGIKNIPSTRSLKDS